MRLKVVLATLLSLVLASPAALAKQPKVCRGVSVKADKFGGGVQARAVILSMGQYDRFGLRLDYSSDATVMTIQTKESGAINASVPPGSVVMFRLEGGEILTLTTAEETTTQPYVDGSSVMTALSYKFTLDEAQFAKFREHPLLGLRLPLVATNSTADVDVKTGLQKKLLGAMECLATL